MTAPARSIEPGHRPAAHYRDLRLLADDITGALDSAAAFTGLFGPLRVATGRGEAASLVVDCGTREKDGAVAAAAFAKSAGLLATKPGRLSFFKLDSLLRGHAGSELAAVLRRQAFDHVIVAPAMPDQGRFTEGGRQMAQRGSLRVSVGEDLAATLAAAGLAVALRRAGARPEPGVTIFDAGSNGDLDRIVAEGLASAGSILWVGSAGLAGALARGLGSGQTRLLPLGLPLLGLIGTDHAAMRAQLAGVAWHCLGIADAGDTTIRSMTAMLDRNGAVFVTCDLPRDIGRQAATTQIAVRFAALVDRLPPPATLFVSGGETLRNLLPGLRAKGLDVLGEHAPGVAVSRLAEGRWKGTTVVSKSGAFGGPDFLASLLASCRIHPGSVLS